MSGTRDPLGVPADVLVEHAAFVRSVARAIVREETEAEDVSQEALARGLTRAPRTPGALRGWLRVIVRNAARAVGRSNQRRARRELAAARPERTASVLETAVQAETIRLVGEAVAGLPGDQRAVVVLRHYEDRPPREIADRLGIPVTTVKARLLRAHAALRERLTAGATGERRRDVLAGFAGLDLASPAGHTVPTGFVPEGAVMAAKGKAISATALTLLVIGGGTFAWMRTEDGASRDSKRPKPTETGMERGTAQLAVRPPPAAPPAIGDRSAPPEPAPPAPPTAEPSVDARRALAVSVAADAIEGIVLDGRGPLEGVKVTVDEVSQQESAPVPATGHFVTRTGPDGTFRWSDMTGNHYTVSFESPGATRRWIQVVDPARKERTRVVMAFGESRLAGRLFDRSGIPAPGRLVHLSDLRSSREPKAYGTALETTTAEDGTFAFTRIVAGTWMLVGFLGPDLDDQATDRREAGVQLALGETKSVDLGSVVAERLWTGTMRTASGTVIPGPGLLWLADLERGVRVRTAIGLKGEISQRLPPGRYRIDAFHEEARGIVGLRLTVGDTDVQQDLVVPGIRVSGRLLDLAIAPAAGASALPPRRTILVTRVGVEGALDRSTMATADGRFAIIGVLPGRYRLSLAPAFGDERTADDVIIDVGDRDRDDLVLNVRPP